MDAAQANRKKSKPDGSIEYLAYCWCELNVDKWPMETAKPFWWDDKAIDHRYRHDRIWELMSALATLCGGVDVCMEFFWKTKYICKPPH